MSITKQPTIASCGTHTMGDSLHGYLEMKIDREILLQDWTSILVIGCHDRSTRTLRSKTEKTDKPFNWQRPTMYVAGEQRLEILCFPGVDYVEHYAAVVATYLSLHGKQAQAEVVRYMHPDPRASLTLLLQSNLSRMGNVDVVVVGYVHGLSPGPWAGDGSADELFGWKILDHTENHRVALLGCRVSFWGDIAGNLIRALAVLNKTRCVLYIGKLGTIRPALEPNRWLATGSCSEIHGETVTWENVLDEVTKTRDLVVRGKHFSLSTVLDESREWLHAHQGQFDFVDPDIGHMGIAAKECGVGYGYLHIISDNLAKKYAYDLSNERLQRVRMDRKRLIREMKEVLAEFFAGWAWKASTARPRSPSCSLLDSSTW
ncbi:hypothetical protein BDW75DRAFT_197945 [Aspergillus navahoensis]